MNGTTSVDSASYRAGGFGYVLAVGGTVAKGLVLAGTLITQAATDHVVEGTSYISGSVTLGLGIGGVLVDWFPSPRGGWHVGGALGVARVLLADGAGTSAGGSILGGYDFWIAPQWSLGVIAIATAAVPTSVPGPTGAPLGYTPATLALEASILCH